MTRLVHLSILDTYGVRWPAITLARDILQNFFDADRDFGEVQVVVDRDRRSVRVDGAGAFDADLLAFIGATTKKDRTTVGGFGEGFKICALVATRDYGVGLRAGTGTAELEVVYRPTPLGRELCYEVSDLDPPATRSWVVLEGCPDGVLDAFDEARHDFRHPGNPRLGETVAGSLEEGVAIVLSRVPERGEVYYRRQKRGEARFRSFHGRPLTLVLDLPVDALEGDRDRRDVSAATVAAEIGARLGPDQLYAALCLLEGSWSHGHEVLGGLLKAAVARNLRFDFPARWISSAGISRIERQLAESKGYKLALAGFAGLGMRTAAEAFPATHPTRPPTDLERARVEVVADLYRALHGKPPTMKHLEVFDGSVAIHGMHLGTRVYMSAKQLAEGFDGAAGTLLHEFAHDAGDESSTGFLDRLEELLDRVVHHPSLVTDARARYHAVTEDDLPPRRFPPPDSRVFATFGEPLQLFVVRGHPPSEALLDAVAEGAARAEVRLAPQLVEVTPEIARHVGLRTVPTLVVRGVELLPVAAEDLPPDGPGPRLFEGRMAPTADDVERFLRGLCPDGHWGPRVASPYGAPRPPPSPPPAVAPRPEPEPDDGRPFELVAAAEGYQGYNSDTIAAVWGWGTARARCELAWGRRGEPGSDEEHLEVVGPEVEVLRQASRRLRSADPTFDPGDPLEAAAMAAAQGYAVAAAATAPELERTPVVEEVFHRVRAATARLYDLYVPSNVRRAVLEATFDQLTRGGTQFGPHPAPSELEATVAEMTRRALIALERDPHAGRGVRAYVLEQLDPANVASVEAEERRAETQARRAADAQRRFRPIWEAALARGGPLEASRAVLEVAFSEVTP